MKPIFANLLLVICLADISSFAHPCTYDKLGVVAPINTIGTFSYSSGQSTYSPPNTTVTIIQSAGTRAYVCQTPTGTNTGLVTVTMQINNRFGSRFCNNYNGQLALQMVCQHLYNLYFTKWASLSTSLMGASTVFQMSHTTSGPIMSVTCPYGFISNSFGFFSSVLADIYSSTLSDMEFDSLCSDMKNTIIASFATAKISNKNLWTNQDSGWFPSIQPKWDCMHTFGSYSLGGLFSIPIGAFDQYTTQALTAMFGVASYRSRGRLCLSLFNKEKDITFFVASSTAFSNNEIPYGLKLISDTFSLRQLVAFNKIYYGYATPKGGLLSYVDTTSMDSSTGGTIPCGPISSSYNLIAAELGLLLIQNKAVTTGAYDGYLGATILPIAGQIVIRVSTHENTAGTNSFYNMLSNIRNRYAFGANIADASNTIYQASISNAYSKLLPNPSHQVTDEGIYSSVLPGDNSGYINWLCLFQGGFKAFADLDKINSGTTADKTAAVLLAISVLYNNATPAITTGYNYMNA